MHLYKKYADRLLDEGKAYEQDGAVFFRTGTGNLFVNSIVKRRDGILSFTVTGRIPAHESLVLTQLRQRFSRSLRICLHFLIKLGHILFYFFQKAAEIRIFCHNKSPSK